MTRFLKLALLIAWFGLLLGSFALDGVPEPRSLPAASGIAELQGTGGGRIPEAPEHGPEPSLVAQCTALLAAPDYPQACLPAPPRVLAQDDKARPFVRAPPGVVTRTENRS